MEEAAAMRLAYLVRIASSEQSIAGETGWLYVDMDGRLGNAQQRGVMRLGVGEVLFRLEDECAGGLGTTIESGGLIGG
jgi:hypothetical protein